MHKLFLYWFNISKLGSTNNGNVATTNGHFGEEEDNAGPKMKMIDVFRIILLHFDVFTEIALEDKIAVLGHIIL